MNYSPAGEAIVVRVLDRHGTQVTVEVEDQGPGIPLDDQVKVFEGFTVAAGLAKETQVELVWGWRSRSGRWKRAAAASD